MVTDATTYKTVLLLVPEMILVVSAAWLFVAGAFTRSRSGWTVFASASYLIAGLALANLSTTWLPEYQADSLVGDPVSTMYLRGLILLVGLLFTIAGTHAVREDLAGEYCGLIMLATVGGMLVAETSELVLLFLGLEMISIPTYIMLYLGRRGQAVGEATIKYFFLSILSSAFLLLGFTLLYGATGSLHLSEIKAMLAASYRDDNFGLLAPAALLLILTGLGFKIAAVPFHFYAPDVYQGAASIHAGWLAVVPKIAGVVALVRIFSAAPLDPQFAWQAAITLALITMTLGNVSALWQNNIRRLLAFSSIAHSGYMLIGLAVGAAAVSSGGYSAMLLYLSLYAIASLGTFAALAHLGGKREIQQVGELAGIGRTHPVSAGALAIFMFSFSGIPPLAGFWGKFSLFAGAVELASGEAGNQTTWFTVLAIVGVINAAIAAAYYLRVVGVMFFQGSAAPLEPSSDGAKWVAAACALVTVVLGCYPGPVVAWSNQSAKAMRNLPAQHFSLMAERPTEDR